MTPQFRCTVLLPGSVKVIGHKAFANAESAEIQLPAGAQWIGDYAFMDCKNIKELPEFHGGLTIGEGTFANCSGIARLVIHGGIEMNEKELSDCSNVYEISCGGDGSYIGAKAFHNCEHLEKVTLMEGVKTVGSGAFFMCRSLSEVELPESLFYIGEMAFVNNQEKVYSEFFDRYVTNYCSTIHAVVSSGSYAENYCKDSGIDFSIK